MVLKVNNSACAMASLRHLYNYFPELSSTPFFTTATGSFTRDYITSKLRTGLAQLGYKGNYSREAGLTDAEIQLLGR